jgi:SAM-dependent methyltransferase
MTNKQTTNRQESEKFFHDCKFSRTQKKSYYDIGFNSIIMQKMMYKIGTLEGKNVIEFGCGTGWFTRKLAKLGCKVWAFDISGEAVRRVREMPFSERLNNRVQVDQMAGEKLDYESEIYDYVIGVAVLHHTDLEKSIKEIWRVLRKGGKAFFMEPLGHNPLLNAFRYLSPHLRSKDERPLRLEQLRQIKAIFPSLKHEEYFLTAILALGLYPTGYTVLVLKARDMLHLIDKKILKICPGLRKYCWYTLLVMEK